MTRSPSAAPIPLLVVAGPTGVGKTEISLELAEKFDAEIVSADSVQVYRGMDIGSAKPTREEQARVPHHVIDVAAPDEAFSAGRYAELAAVAIEDITGRGKRPLLVGGSGLYLRALLEGLVTGASADPEVRRLIGERLTKEGLAAVRARLEDVDPASAARIHANDAYRIARALEVFELTGEPLSELQERQRRLPPAYDARWLGLTEDRPVLYDRIEARCDRMIAAGFLEEVVRLREEGFGLDLRPLRSLGYRQMGDVVRGEQTLPEALDEMKKETRRYAKRQITWFRARPGISWLSPTRERRAILDSARVLLERGRAA
ncbi:MAG: tRNA (adenosine(37)-N6)-dimethylallyltransferase MiaA [Deltaproteobacteria bacterium]|nr:tRNA (adenosine(37)-N6)-dimethylallyltransferase MiaA [Deltaproteobacteria bacterium]